jgi:DMATS type aromatic prenyltransferase
MASRAKVGTPMPTLPGDRQSPTDRTTPNGWDPSTPRLAEPQRPLRPGDACTYSAAASATLQRLSTALGHPENFERWLAIQSHLFEGWGQREIPEAPIYTSNIGDDHSPYEYSLGFEPGAGADLRLLVEAQAEVPTAIDNQAAALHLNERLRARYRLSLARFDRVRDLFIVDQPHQFSLWHAVGWKPDGGADFKVYLNPQARGVAQALPLIKEAFWRLGLGRSQPFLDAMIRRGELDELKYFSLDLSASANARVKVYLVHHDATLADLEAAFALSPSHRAGDVTGFCQELLGSVSRFRQRAVTSCFSFTAGAHAPSAATFHLPIASYLPGDAPTLRVVARLLQRHGIDPILYQRAFAAIARHEPSEGHATQSYASFRRERGRFRITTYLSPRLFGG